MLAYLFVSSSIDDSEPDDEEEEAVSYAVRRPFTLTVVSSLRRCASLVFMEMEGMV